MSVGDFEPSMSSCRSSLLSLAIVVAVWSGDWRTGWLTGVALLTAIPVIVGDDGAAVDSLVDEESDVDEDGFGVGRAFVGRGLAVGGDLLTSVSPMKAKTPWSLWSSSMLAIKEAT